MDVKGCCKQEENLEMLAEDQDESKPDRLVRRCRVCHCRHITVEAEAGALGLRITNLRG